MGKDQQELNQFTFSNLPLILMATEITIISLGIMRLVQKIVDGPYFNKHNIIHLLILLKLQCGTRENRNDIHKGAQAME